MKVSSQTIASDRVTDRQCEEAERDGDQNDVQHGSAPGDGELSARRRARGKVLRSAHARLPVTERIGIREEGGGCSYKNPIKMRWRRGGQMRPDPYTDDW